MICENDYILVSFCSLQSVLCEVKGQPVDSVSERCMHRRFVKNNALHHMQFMILLLSVFVFQYRNINIVKSRHWIYWRSKH